MASRSPYKIQDHLGQRFGSRVPVRRVENRGGAQFWVMRCDCGSEDEVSVGPLFRGRAKTCLQCAAGGGRGEASTSWKGCGPVTGAAVANFRATALKRGLEWGVTVEDIAELHAKQNGRCALSGHPLIYRVGKSGKQPRNCASLDRVDSSKGYTKDNIQLTTAQVNMAKQALPQDVFIALCRDIAEWTRGA